MRLLQVLQHLYLVCGVTCRQQKALAVRMVMPEGVKTGCKPDEDDAEKQAQQMRQKHRVYMYA